MSLSYSDLLDLARKLRNELEKSIDQGAYCVPPARELIAEFDRTCGGARVETETR